MSVTMNVVVASVLLISLEAYQALHTLDNLRTSVYGAGGRDAESCIPLANKGTHFAVDVNIGTPPQTFNVVADTGSNFLIVPSCICQQEGGCTGADNCFRGSNGKSATFSLPQGPDGPKDVLITFGSGTIEAVLASDQARVGGITAQMNESILLMIDDSQLRINGPFEGILGLGIPGSVLAGNDNEGEDGAGATIDDLKRIWKRIFGDVSAPEGTSDNPVEEKGVSALLQRYVTEEKLKEKGFLEEANVGRFSMCFNDRTQGALRLRSKKRSNALGSVGTAHWGLGLTGITLGSNGATVPVKVCNPFDLKEGQETPCGAIPDSGTTMIMGPEDQVAEVYASICDNWDRCKGNYHRRSKLDTIAKAETFLQLLLDCAEWLTSDDGLYELPTFTLHLTGSTGKPQKVELSGWSYVLESVEDELSYVYEHNPTFEDLIKSVTEGGRTRQKKVCSPAFGKMEYHTQKNGPVWILGTPLFYEFEVGYDLDAAPPAVSFTKLEKHVGCGACAHPALLAAGASNATSARAGPRAPRRIAGPARVARIDTRRPL